MPPDTKSHATAHTGYALDSLKGSEGEKMKVIGAIMMLTPNKLAMGVKQAAEMKTTVATPTGSPNLESGIAVGLRTVAKKNPKDMNLP